MTMPAAERSRGPAGCAHECDEVSFWRECDAQGIYLCRVCDVCVEEKLARYRPEILRGYSQADVDEPIEE